MKKMRMSAGGCKIIIIVAVFMIIVIVGVGVGLRLANLQHNQEQEFRESGYERQWYLLSESNIDIGVEKFWSNYNHKAKRELVIAVLDSCVDIYHEDLVGHIWINDAEVKDNGIDDDNNGYTDDYYGWNFDTTSPRVYSNAGNAEHGTHCAGIIAAAHNDLGIKGILGSTNVKLMIVPMCGEKAPVSENLVSAIKYADSMGADICCVSSVFTEGHDIIQEAIEESDMYFVVAAGNFQSQYVSGLNLDEYTLFPACCNLNNVITVASISSDEKLSEFSNYSPVYVDIAAPGEHIYSTLPDNQYGYRDGTSMAVPIVVSVLGAYYYETGSMKSAVNKLLSNSSTDVELNKYVKDGRIVRYAQ